MPRWLIDGRDEKCVARLSGQRRSGGVLGPGQGAYPLVGEATALLGFTWQAIA